LGTSGTVGQDYHFFEKRENLACMSHGMMAMEFDLLKPTDFQNDPNTLQRSHQ